MKKITGQLEEKFWAFQFLSDPAVTLAAALLVYYLYYNRPDATYYLVFHKVCTAPLLWLVVALKALAF